jgi:hypothetical protein
MDDRKLGLIYSAIGSPAALGVVGTLGVFTASGTPRTLLWSVPLTIVTLPLLPFWLLGEKMINEVENEEFELRVAELPHLDGPLPEDFTYIEAFRDENEEKDRFYVNPFYYMGNEDAEEPFDSEEEARLFLQSLGYHEVVFNSQGNRSTYWIKREHTNG